MWLQRLAGSCSPERGESTLRGNSDESYGRCDRVSELPTKTDIPVSYEV